MIARNRTRLLLPISLLVFGLGAFTPAASGSVPASSGRMPCTAASTSIADLPEAKLEAGCQDPVKFGRLASDQKKLAHQARRLQKLLEVIEEREREAGNEARAELLAGARKRLEKVGPNGNLAAALEQVAKELTSMRSGNALEQQAELIEVLTELLDYLLDREIKEQLDALRDIAKARREMLEDFVNRQQELMDQTRALEAQENATGKVNAEQRARIAEEQRRLSEAIDKLSVADKERGREGDRTDRAAEAGKEAADAISEELPSSDQSQESEANDEADQSASSESDQANSSEENRNGESSQNENSASDSKESQDRSESEEQSDSADEKDSENAESQDSGTDAEQAPPSERENSEQQDEQQQSSQNSNSSNNPPQSNQQQQRQGEQHSNQGQQQNRANQQKQPGENLEQAQEKQQEALDNLQQEAQEAAQEEDQLGNMEELEELLDLLEEATALMEQHQAMLDPLVEFVKANQGRRAPRSSRVQLRQWSNTQTAIAEATAELLIEVRERGADAVPFLMDVIAEDHQRLAKRLGPPSYRAGESQIQLAQRILKNWMELIEAIRTEAERVRKRIEQQNQSGGGGSQPEDEERESPLVGFAEEIQLLKRMEEDLRDRLQSLWKRRELLAEAGMTLDEDDIEELDAILERQNRLRRLYDAILEQLEEAAQNQETEEA